MLSQEDIRELRATTPISSVVGQTVSLHRQGRGYIACCPFHADSTPSLSICDEKGLFHCFGCGAAGDVFKFVMMRDGVSFSEAVNSLQNGCFPTSTTPSLRKASETKAIAEKIWRNGEPIQGTAAERYLERRGLPLASLPSLPSLRFARLSYSGSPVRHPTLVALVTDLDGACAGIQRTYLTEDGAKLDVPDPKRSLGQVKGGAIRFGQSTKEIIVCEGAEDGLSLLLALPHLSVWVAAGAGMMAGMRLPRDCQSVTIAADNDEAGMRAAAAAATAFQQQGKTTRLMRPSHPWKDFNQQLQGLAA